MRKITAAGISLASGCLAASMPATAFAAGFEPVGASGFSVFGGVFSAADNPDLAMEGPGRDIGRDVAAFWVTYRWKDGGRSGASCEVNLSRLDAYGFYGAMPDQAEEDAKAAAFHKRVYDERANGPHRRLEVSSRPWGSLTLHEIESENEQWGEVLSLSSIYVEDRYTYEISFRCAKGSIADSRALFEAIAPDNLTRQ